VVLGLLLSGNAYAKLGKIKEANEEFVYYTVHSFWPDKARAANMDEMIPIEVIDHCGKFKKNTYKFYGDNGKGWGATRNPKRYICAQNSDVAIQIAKNSNSEWQKKFEIRCNKTGFSIWTNRSNKPRNVKGEYCYHISIKEERYQTWNTEKEKLKEAKKKKFEENNSYLKKLYRPHPKEIRWMVDAKSYYNQKPEYPIDSVKLGFSKISFMVAAKNALNKCREDMEFNGGKPDGCLVSAIQTHGKIKRYIELGVFDKSIAFYEKNIIVKKPKKKEPTKKIDRLITVEKCLSVGTNGKHAKHFTNLYKFEFNLDNKTWRMEVDNGLLTSRDGEIDPEIYDKKIRQVLGGGTIKTKEYNLKDLITFNDDSNILNNIKANYTITTLKAGDKEYITVWLNILSDSLTKKQSKFFKNKLEFWEQKTGNGPWYWMYELNCKKRYASNFDDVEDDNIKISELLKKPVKKNPKQIPKDEKIVPAGSGSGFFVSRDGHIITNHHVIDGCNITKVSFKGNQIDAQILAVDKMNDIAILKTNIKPSNIFPISNEDVSLLEDVVVAGYPLGKQVSSAIKTHKGVVTALAGAGDNYSNFQTDATINAGNSGGPIMNQKGNVVGIAVQTWVEEGVQGIHFGIKSSTLKTFANSNSLTFSQPNNRELTNKDLGKLITEATVYIECHMTIAKIKKMIAQADNRKAFFSEFK